MTSAPLFSVWTIFRSHPTVRMPTGRSYPYCSPPPGLIPRVRARKSFALKSLCCWSRRRASRLGVSRWHELRCSSLPPPCRGCRGTPGSSSLCWGVWRTICGGTVRMSRSLCRWEGPRWSRWCRSTWKESWLECAAGNDSDRHRWERWRRQSCAYGLDRWTWIWCWGSGLDASIQCSSCNRRNTAWLSLWRRPY